MIEFSTKMNGTPIRSKPSEEGNGGSDMGLCISLRKGIDAFWKKRGMSGNADYTYYSKTKCKTPTTKS
jgi:hypothetical protein